jgi:hypothetical protein
MSRFNRRPQLVRPVKRSSLMRSQNVCKTKSARKKVQINPAQEKVSTRQSRKIVPKMRMTNKVRATFTIRFLIKTQISTI